MSEIRSQFNPESDTNLANLEINNFESKDSNNKDLKIEQIMDGYTDELNAWIDKNPDTPLDEIPPELYPAFIPKKLWNEANNPEKVQTKHIHNGEGINFFVIQDLPNSKIIPNRVDQTYHWAKLKGYTHDNQEIIMRCHMYLRGQKNDILYVADYDAIENKGIGTEFYTELLPKIARSKNIRFITGKNDKDNISFFSNPNGLNRAKLSEIKPEYRYDFFPEIGLEDLIEEDFSIPTVQFLYEEDKEKYLIKAL